MPRVVICPYCQTVNPSQALHCVACGAPLEEARPSPQEEISAIRMPNAPRELSASRERETLHQLQEQGEKLDELVSGAYRVYSLAWCTIAEAVSITAACLGLGVIGGATGVQGWGVLGATLVGAAVGWTIKAPYFTLLGAPVGFLVGTLVGMVLWAFGLGKGVLVFPVTLFAVVAALVAGRQVPYSRRRTWHKLRPFLGALAGLALGLVGMLVGWGLQATVAALLG